MPHFNILRDLIDIWKHHNPKRPKWVFTDAQGKRHVMGPRLGRKLWNRIKPI